jgi:transcriptional/translational regulatory protein YebC/TACO1
MGVEVESAELQRIANTTKSLPKEDAKKVLRMVEEFEELDDVQSVFHNLEVTDEILAEMEE